MASGEWWKVAISYNGRRYERRLVNGEVQSKLKLALMTNCRRLPIRQSLQ